MKLLGAISLALILRLRRDGPAGVDGIATAFHFDPFGFFTGAPSNYDLACQDSQAMNPR